MSIERVGDIILHLTKFENFDCLSYGKYRLKIKITKIV